MRKSLIMLVFALITISFAASCREEKSTGEKIEEGIEEGAEEVEDAVEDATDHN